MPAPAVVRAVTHAAIDVALAGQLSVAGPRAFEEYEDLVKI